MRMMTHPIPCPCMLALQKSLLFVTRNEAERLLAMRHLGDDLLLLSHGNSPAFELAFVVDSQGGFRAASIVRKRRAWLGGLSWLHDLVLSEVRLSPPSTISNHEMIERVRRLTDHPSRGRAVAHYLRARPPGELFDAQAFRQCWDAVGPKLDEAEWGKVLP